MIHIRKDTERGRRVPFRGECCSITRHVNRWVIGRFCLLGKNVCTEENTLSWRSWRQLKCWSLNLLCAMPCNNALALEVKHVTDGLSGWRSYPLEAFQRCFLSHVVVCLCLAAPMPRTMPQVRLWAAVNPQVGDTLITARNLFTLHNFSFVIHCSLFSLNVLICLYC